EWSVWRLVSGRMRPAPVFNHVDATGLQQWEEDFKGRFCLLISVRCIVDHQIELICQFIPNDLLQNFTIALRRRKVNEPIFHSGDIAQKRCHRLWTYLHSGHSPGVKELVQQHVAPALENPKFKDCWRREVGRDVLITAKIGLVFDNCKDLRGRWTP